MTADDIALVRASWAGLQPRADATATALYQRLFTEYPQVRPLFIGEMDEQAAKLKRMIDRTVAALDDLEPLDRVIRMMGARHSGYGVAEEDYPLLREALLITLAEQLGEEFSPQIRAAWIAVYDELAEMMIAGANA